MYKEYLKIYLIRLKNTLHYEILLNNYFLIVVNITLTLLCLNYLYFIILLLIFDIYLFKFSKDIFKISLLFSLVVIFHFVILNNLHTLNCNDGEEVLIEAVVIDIEEKDTYNKLECMDGYKKYIVIDKKKENVKVSDKIKVYGNIKNVSSNYNENEFNYHDYLEHNKYSAYINATDVAFIKKIIHPRLIKNYLNSYLDNFDEGVKRFINGLMFAKSSMLTEDFYDSLKVNGIIHLFAVSGLHISLFLGFFDKFYLKIKLKKNIQYIANIVFLYVYLIITDYTPSILRVSISYLIKLISDNFFKSKRLSSLDVQSLSFVILIVINPYYMYNIGFILSFLASFTIILSSDLVKKYSNILQTLLLSVLSMITTLPIVCNMSYEINLFIPFINVIFISLVSYVILPVTIISFFVPPLSKLYNYIIISFQEVSIFFSKYINLSINIPHMSIISIVLYYLLLGLIFKYFYVIKKSKQRIVSFLISVFLVISFFCFQNGFFINDCTYFLYLDNGDCTIIIEDKTVVVIDTGEGLKNEVSNFLLSKGIKKIDCLILTHNHSDHNGEAKDIINKFRVSKIIVSAYDNSEFRYYKNSSTVQCGDEVRVKNLKFKVLSPKKNHSDVNDNSLVLLTYLQNKLFLFTGDLTKDGEKEILNSLVDVDVLKVGHHGSKTSTSLDFLKVIKPEYAIIMTGRVKKFGFPHNEAVRNLESMKCKIYRTDQDYMISYKNGKFKTLNSSVH